MNLLFTGDIAFNQAGLTKDVNPLVDLVQLSQEFDATILSLDSGFGLPPQGPWRKIYISCPFEYLKWLEQIPRLVINLANNHSFDNGDDSFIKGTTLLSNFGIKYLGAGTNFDNATQSFTITSDDTKVAILARVAANCSPGKVAGKYESGPAPFDFVQLTEQAQGLRRTHDFVILCIHWGKELISLPLPEEYHLGQKLLEYFDLVIGNHSHVVRGYLESGNIRRTYFSLGNVLFGDIQLEDSHIIFKQGPMTRIGLLLKVQANKRQPLEITPISVVNTGFETFLDLEGKAVQELKRQSKYLTLSEPKYVKRYHKVEWMFRIWTYRYHFRFRAYGLLDSMSYLLHRNRRLI